MRRLITTLMVAGVILMPATALAQANVPEQQQGAGTGSQAQLTRLIGLADKQITSRINTLNTLLKALTNSPHLSTSDKAALTAQINAEISSLNQLKTKIDADTSIQTLRTDIQSIYTEFRVYVLIVPKVHLMRVADRLSDAINKLSAYADALQTKIDVAKTQGHDVTSLTATLTDMRSQIAKAKTDLAAVESKIMSVTPDQYNSDKTVVTSARDSLNAARTALHTALKDGNQIRQGLKALK